MVDTVHAVAARSYRNRLSSADPVRARDHPTTVGEESLVGR
ncbi:hypothetical protein B0E53_02921 [Micromonospora sp. MH33]|nr:hypothetical protein B0E53_02921 [Micromonospora sp. MH33]